MNAIATSVDDSFQRMRDKLDAEKLRPHHAMDPYFYRSHLVHEQELEHLIFKSWIYALHASEIPSAGDYQLVESVRTRSSWRALRPEISGPCTTSVATAARGSVKN